MNVREEAEEAPGEFGFVLRDGQGGERQTAEADLIPVVFGPMPPVVPFVRINTLTKTLFDERGSQRGPAGRGKVVIEPVVADRERGAHDRDVEEVTGVPVGKCRRSEKIAFGGVEETALAREVVGGGQPNGVFQHATGDGEQSPAP